MIHTTVIHYIVLFCCGESMFLSAPVVTCLLSRTKFQIRTCHILQNHTMLSYINAIYI